VVPPDGDKDPWHIFLPGDEAFSFAGLWAYNRETEARSAQGRAGLPRHQAQDRRDLTLQSSAG
jgi:putative SOS response-associated peptidase YedK